MERMGGSYRLNIPDVVPQNDMARNEDSFVREVRTTAAGIIDIATRIMNRANSATSSPADLEALMRDVWAIGTECRELNSQATHLRYLSTINMENNNMVPWR